MMIESLNEGVWSKQEIIDLFTKSPQKIFVLHGDHLFLKKRYVLLEFKNP